MNLTSNTVNELYISVKMILSLSSPAIFINSIKINQLYTKIYIKLNNFLIYFFYLLQKQLKYKISLLNKMSLICAKNNFISLEVKFKNQIKYMQKKRSNSHKSNSTTKKKNLSPKKKMSCLNCDSKIDMTIRMQKSLYIRYSEKHFSQLLIINNCMAQAKPFKGEAPKQYLQKYYKTVHRKHELPRIKQIYKMHHETPRLFMADIKDIIHKCQHRKRLLEYFKIAKILGIRVDTVKFSTFMLSLSQSQHNKKKKPQFDPLIGKVSGYEFSEDVQRQLIQALSMKQNSMQASNRPNNYNIHDKTSHQQTAASLNQLRIKI